ncbi:hypothetical protein JTB14_033561 [Gonioctena quinquepunctata]|nr:hypothetical protein JTB14_033561 [Gonioctena quinquepunctata]
MGNEQSQSSGIEVDEKAVEVSDFWSQHSASILGSDSCTNLSVFVGELFVSGSLWSTQTPLEKCAKNMMIFRHPCIIKYISSWQKNSKHYLAVEEVTPLSQILPTLNMVQISIGLYSVLKALCFLHQKALVSHNNVCTASIYVTKDGNWKLGGMEYLCSYKDMNCDYLSKTRTSRYSKSLDPNEDKLLQNNLGRRDFIDIFAFGILVCEILKSKIDDEIASLSSFRDFCKNELQNCDLSKRPNFKSILEHEFFNHEFVKIHSFLVELPLKSDEEKNNFFQNLGAQLLTFDEQVVASQLGGLLLSRLVLFNKIAQDSLLPYLLLPRSDIQPQEQPSCIFSEETFKKYLCPKLLEIFRVRDAQIRLLLLYHFPNFMNMFTCEELQSSILPELLVGIKDTNDHLVSMTLKILGELVPILGAATIIGEPTAVSIPSNTVSEVDQISFSSSGMESTNVNLNDLPERPRPDGEEGETSTEEVSVEEDLENWEDWEINESSPNSNINVVNIEDDLSTPDMEPVIETTNKFNINDNDISMGKNQ